jgi:hypothetical protein
MKQPSESLAGANGRPVTPEQWADRRWACSVQAIVRACSVAMFVHKGHVGRGSSAVGKRGEGEEAAMINNKRGTSWLLASR